MIHSEKTFDIFFTQKHDFPGGTKRLLCFYASKKISFQSLVLRCPRKLTFLVFQHNNIARQATKEGEEEAEEEEYDDEKKEEENKHNPITNKQTDLWISVGARFAVIPDSRCLIPCDQSPVPTIALGLIPRLFSCKPPFKSNNYIAYNWVSTVVTQRLRELGGTLVETNDLNHGLNQWFET